MVELVDETHDPKRTSWVASANGHPEFPIQNLPFGIFSPPGEAPRGGVAIGDEILDLRAALEAGLLSGEAERAAATATDATLNPLMAQGAGPRIALRFFGAHGWDASLCSDPTLLERGYGEGVAMGGRLDASSAPSFVVQALADQAPLWRAQIVKVWLDAAGSHERVFDLGADPDPSAGVDDACAPTGVLHRRGRDDLGPHDARGARAGRRQRRDCRDSRTVCPAA